jgi:hypothetical protein
MVGSRRSKPMTSGLKKMKLILSWAMVPIRKKKKLATIDNLPL